VFALEQARADVARRRPRWRSWQARFDPMRLVFIDETWIKTNIAPLRAAGSERPTFAWLRATRPLANADHPRRTALQPRLAAPCVFDGPINGECFRAYVEQLLLPVLKAGTVALVCVATFLVRAGEALGRVFGLVSGSVALFVLL